MSENMFNTQRDKSDIIIALAVIGFFLWLFLFSGILGEKKDLKGLVGDTVAAVTDETESDDIDNDGIKNEIDNCPNEAGSLENGGCPNRDSDGDGVFDSRDVCPTKSGPISNYGCPEDEVVDTKKGNALVAPVTISNDDTDGDGVLNKDDKCPNEQGIEENDGCPMMDADNDGISDELDECPDLKGSKTMKGCPDSDNDGVIDTKDRCPNEVGTAENNGCPTLTLLEEEQSILDEEVKNIQFELASANLTPESKEIMNKVGALLNKYSEAKLNIAGHTDNDSSAATNLKLSEYRAKSCKAYLEGLGIAGDRISTTWFGESKPIASNATEEGRQQNRRVEFELSN